MEIIDKNTKDIQEYFKTHKYVVVRNFLDPNILITLLFKSKK